jgi:hypothetical protein
MFLKLRVAKVRNSEVEYPIPQKKRILAQQNFWDVFSLQSNTTFGFTNRKISGIIQP